MCVTMTVAMPMVAILLIVAGRQGRIQRGCVQGGQQPIHIREGRRSFDRRHVRSIVDPRQQTVRTMLVMRFRQRIVFVGMKTRGGRRFRPLPLILRVFGVIVLL